MASSIRKSVLITGCSAGGIGAALAEAFHGKGYKVFATVRNPSKIPQTLSSAANTTILTLDVLSSDSIAAAVENVRKETGGKLDVLVNNSGGGLLTPALDTSIEDGKKLFDLNFWAPLAMLQAFAPLLIASKGCIVSNASASAYCPMALGTIYNSSKAALAMASETWRRELQPFGVRTITLITCAVKTEFFENNHAVELPETSRYFEIRDFVRDISDGRLQANAISSRQYATKVVQQVEKGAVGTVWAGTNATLLKWLWWLSPQYVSDLILESIIPLSSAMTKAAQRRKA